MSNNISGWEAFVKDQEDQHEKACLDCAIKNGHSKQEAELCEDFSVGCIDCPFSETPNV